MRALTAATAYLSLIVLSWYVLAIMAHAPATNCGRACFDAGMTENPNITLMVQE